MRVRRTSNLVLFVVDASWSMAAAERMEATKGAILSLLHNACQRRDQVGLVVFQREGRGWCCPRPPAWSWRNRPCRDIPVGGKTPLSAGLLLAYQLCMGARRRDAEVLPLVIILTDGAGNVSVTGLPPQEETGLVAGLIHQNHFRSVVVNMEHPAFDRGLANQLALDLGGVCYTLPELRADTLVETVKGAIRG